MSNTAFEQIAINFGNYQAAATRTRSQLGSKSADSAHMCLGLSGEFGELSTALENQDVANIIEESGDITWYIAGECDIQGISFEELADEVNQIDPEQYDSDEQDITDYIDFVKRQFAYGKDCDTDKLRLFMRYFLWVVKNIAWNEGRELQEILQININKLHVRYPDKFNNFDALNRNLEEEYKTLN